MSTLHLVRPSNTAADSGTSLPLPPDNAQRIQALDICRSWIVEAPAGSGKTGLLIQRFLKLLGAVNEPEAVLALTFTNKATAEMRNRVLDALGSAAEPDYFPDNEFEKETLMAARAALLQSEQRGWQLRDNPHRLNIRTIDSLCGEIAHAVPVLTGGVGQATPLPDASELYRSAARAVFLQLGGQDAELNSALSTVLLHRDGDLRNCEQLLADMLATREQWGALVPLTQAELDEWTLDEVVLPKLNRTLRFAICQRLTAIQQAFPETLLEELVQVAHDLSREPGHGERPNPLLGCASLRTIPGAELVDLDHWKMLAHLLLTGSGGWRNSFLVHHIFLAVPKPTQVRLKTLIDTFRENHALRELLCSLQDLPPDTYPEEQWRVAKALFRLLHHTLIELKLLFAEREVCDFSELSIAARSALKEPNGANRVTHALGMGLQHLLVDEMQDTSSTQYELLEDLTRGWSAPEQTVFLVGDPKQSIYLFRQARVERFMESMKTGFLGDVPLGTLQLTANFRSGAKLVASFNRMFSSVFAGPQDDVSYSAAAPVLKASAGEELRWHAEPLAASDDPDQKALERKRSRREQAETIAKLASDWRSRSLPADRTKPRKIAVLVRSKQHAVGIMRKLTEAHVPFRAIEMQQLGERQEVLDALALTRALLHPADRVAWLAVLRAPWCGATLTDLHTLASGDVPERSSDALRVPFRRQADRLEGDTRRRVLRTLDVLDAAVRDRGRISVAEQVEHVWHQLGANLYSTELEAVNVRRYFDLLHQEEELTGSVVTARLMERMQKLFAEPDPTPGSVEVMTIHKAKGLEWDMVLVPGLERVAKTDAAPLLDWIELSAEEPGTHVLLAPVPARGDEAGSLNRYIRKAKGRQEAAELKRLLYVVATRARTSLQLFASPARTKSGFEVRQNTLLHTAWELAAPLFEATADSAGSTGGTNVVQMPAPQVISSLAAGTPQPVLKRLPLFIDPAELLRSSVLSVELAGGKPQPPVSFERPQGSFRARALGNAVHTFLEYLARWITLHPEAGRDVDALLKEISGWKRRIHTVVRGSGFSPREVDRVAEDVEQALQNTVRQSDGLWLLQPHLYAVSEAELMGTSEDGPPRRYRMDRSFFAGSAPGLPGNEVLWIVDYKTASRSEAQQPLFFESERQKYGPQLSTYAALRLQTLPADTPVMLALCHPLVPNLQFWPYQP